MVNRMDKANRPARARTCIFVSEETKSMADMRAGDAERRRESCCRANVPRAPRATAAVFIFIYVCLAEKAFATDIAARTDATPRCCYLG
jgi:hypothetical protein